MSDGNAIADALEGAAAGGAGTPPQGAQGQQGQQGSEGGAAAPPPAANPGSEPPAPPPAWMSGLPEDLQSNETLRRMGSVEDLAKGYVQTRDWAKGRIALPKEGDDASFNEFAQRLRPASAEDYKIAVPDGGDDTMAKAFAGAAFDMGLHPVQASRAAEWFNSFQADAMSKFANDQKQELASLELEMGPSAWARGTEAVTNMLRNAGVEIADIAPALQQVGGSRKSLEALMVLAEKTGEMGKVDGASVELRLGNMTPEQADAEVKRMFADPETRKQLADPKSSAFQKYQNLLTVQAKG